MLLNYDEALIFPFSYNDTVQVQHKEVPLNLKRLQNINLRDFGPKNGGLLFNFCCKQHNVKCVQGGKKAYRRV